MLRVSRLDDGMRVTDDAKNTVRFHARDWSELAAGDTTVSVAETLDGRDVGPDEPSLVVPGEASRLEFPPVFVAAVPLDGGERERFGGNLTELALPAAEYLLRIEASVRVFLRVDGPLRLRRESGESLWVEFPGRRSFELAFASRVDRPDGTVTIPKTPDGVARGLSVVSSGNDTTSPDRTWPTMRGRPPLFEFGETFAVPDEVDENVEDTGIEVVVPPRLDALVPVASLVNYLGADVSVEEYVSPRVDVDGLSHSLGDLDTLPRRAADLLRRTFYLDCVARGAGPHGGTLSVADTFDTLGLDAERLYEASMAERVQTYLAADFASVREAFPEWHLSMYVDATYENAGTLPYLVDSVPFLFRPAAEPLSEQEWLELSLTGGGFGTPPERTRGPGPYSDSSGFGRREVSNVDLLDPDLGPGRTHGWLADGVPIDAFKSMPAAYCHRDDALDDAGDTLSVTAVVNETDMGRVAFSGGDGPTMADEHEAAVEHYRGRGDELNASIDVRENVSTVELARIFESENDLVHFIGHHEDAGLCCHDGFLSADSLDRSRARTFFLNACGSYPFGERLVEKGSVAGGVTFASVTDSDAAEVGTTFARLLINGFCISRGLATAARHAIAPRDYTVIGDGTFGPSQSDDIVPPNAYVVPGPDETFRLLLQNNQPRVTGGQTAGSLNDDSTTDLYGKTRFHSLSKKELVEFLEEHDLPVAFNRELTWSDELRKRM